MRQGGTSGDAIDYKNRYIAVRGARGQALAPKVADDIALEQRKNAGKK
jgi:hypothetical protein